MSWRWEICGKVTDIQWTMNAAMNSKSTSAASVKAIVDIFSNILLFIASALTVLQREKKLGSTAKRWFKYKEVS